MGLIQPNMDSLSRHHSQHIQCCRFFSTNLADELIHPIDANVVRQLPHYRTGGLDYDHVEELRTKHIPSRVGAKFVSLISSASTAMCRSFCSTGQAMPSQWLKLSRSQPPLACRIFVRKLLLSTTKISMKRSISRWSICATRPFHSTLRSWMTAQFLESLR